MKLTRFHCVKILDWCIEKWGRSKYNRNIPLSLEFRKPNHTEVDLLGEYDYNTNTIFINSVDHSELEELCKTVIEEYYHYLQSYREFEKLYENHNYDNHPHEVNSKKLADKYYSKCIKDLSRFYSQFEYLL